MMTKKLYTCAKFISFTNKAHADSSIKSFASVSKKQRAKSMRLSHTSKQSTVNKSTSVKKEKTYDEFADFDFR